MSSKNKVIFVGSFLILLVLLSLIFFFMPTIKIKINGSQNITLFLGEEYIEQGASAYFEQIFTKKDINVETSGYVDSSKPGKYMITYHAHNNWLNENAVRIIKVVDKEKPLLILNREVKICKKNSLLELDASAVDNYDGDISNNIKYKIKNDEIIISVSDSSGNIAELSQQIKYIDKEKPMLTLKGERVIYMNVGEKYTELGVEAYDSCDGNITKNIEIEGVVDTNTAGTYRITYKITDSFGNEVKLNRTVIVNSPLTFENQYPVINGATIYLTFDDGPGPYTEQILNILDKYDVKATFFVTNQFPEYQNLIKNAYDKGHAIGVHTYSHKWTIYESVESYLKDFQKIEDIVFEQIGIRPKIFRFPGGSSNTVSRNYSKGIMKRLAQVMTNKGYTYFDWTFDSGDTNKKDNSKEAIIKNVKANLKGDGDYVVLMHDIKSNTLQALPEIIEYAQTSGYNFASLNETSPTEHFKIAN